MVHDDINAFIWDEVNIFYQDCIIIGGLWCHCCFEESAFHLSVRSGCQMTDSLLIAVHAFVSCLSMSDGCITWTLTKRLEKMLDGHHTRMLRVILNKSERQHPKKHQLFGHLPPFRKTIQVRRTEHAGQCWRSRDELISDVLLWNPSHWRAKAGWPTQITFSSSVRKQDVALRTYQKRWQIGRSGERGSGISVLVARQDDDDNDINASI